MDSSSAKLWKCSQKLTFSTNKKSVKPCSICKIYQKTILNEKLFKQINNMFWLLQSKESEVN